MLIGMVIGNQHKYVTNLFSQSCALYSKKIVFNLECDSET